MPGAEQSNRALLGRRRFVRWLVVAICTLLFVGLLCAVLAFYGDLSDDIACKMRLKRGLWNAVATDDTPPRLLQKLEGTWRCPKSGMAYEYRPFEGPVELGSPFAPFEDPDEGSDTKLRVIAWCSSPCHAGRRNILLETGAVIPIPERAFQELAYAGFSATWKELMRMVESK